MSQRTEETKKDHYDSDFIYPKVATKTSKETIPYAQKVISDSQFEIVKKNRSDPSLHDIHQSLLVQSHGAKKNSHQFIFEKSTRE